MCTKHSTVRYRGDITFRIDPCMKETIRRLREKGIETLACCCGHGKYPETIIVKTQSEIKELHSNILIPRKRRFYVKDEEGDYYIPENSKIRRDEGREE